MFDWLEIKSQYDKIQKKLKYKIFECINEEKN